MKVDENILNFTQEDPLGEGDLSGFALLWSRLPFDCEGHPLFILYDNVAVVAGRAP